MKSYNMPTKLKDIIEEIGNNGKDIYSYSYLVEHLSRQKEITMLDWLISNREIYNNHMLNRKV